jgi:hypothetical protein
MPNPTKFSWVNPTTNTDSSAIVAGEITGYEVGVRSTTVAGSVAGTYPIKVEVTSPTATDALVSAAGVLAPDTYAAAVRAVGPADSAWSTEATFTIALPVPNPPTGFTVA